MPDDYPDLVNKLAQLYAEQAPTRNALSMAGVPASPAIGPELQASLYGPHEAAMQQARGLQAGMMKANPIELAMGLMGPRVGPGRMIAYHGSPEHFSEFKTPAFFSNKEGVARQYRNEGGGGDNLNGLGGKLMSDGYYWAHSAIDRAGGDRAKALELLANDVKQYSAPGPQDYEKRGLIDVLLGRQPKVSPQAQAFLDRQREASQAGMDYLQSGKPVGAMYEVSIPEPTAHYGDFRSNKSQAQDIADAIAKGHKVITWGGSPGDHNYPSKYSEIIALDKSVIEILRKYGILGPAALGAASNALAPDKAPQQ